MNDRSSGRRCGLVFLIAACAQLVLPVAAESDSSIPGVSDNVPPVQDVLGQARHQLGGVGSQPPTAPADRSVPQSGTTATPKRTAAPGARTAGPRPATPSGAGKQAGGPSPAGYGGDPSAGTAARAASPGSDSGAGDDASETPARAVDAADAPEAGARPPSELGDNPGNESPDTLPFTGSRPLSLLTLGLLALALGLGVRRAVRGRLPAGAP
jgi:hypothetical protein